MTFGTNLRTLSIGLMKCGRARWQEAEARRKDLNIYCTDLSGQEILCLRALQGHSGRNPTDPTLHDNVLIPNNFFECVYHIGCAFISHSITNSGLKLEGQNSSSERQTIFFTAVNPKDRDHKDPYELDLTKPSCIVQAEEVEKAPRYAVLGRFSACSTKRIEVLSQRM